MPEILSTIEQIKQFAPINMNLDIDTLSPYIIPSQYEYLERDWLGAAIITDIKDKMAETDAFNVKLRELTQRALASFTVLSAIPFLEVNMSDGGITRPDSDRQKTAYRGQIYRLERDLMTRGYNALEQVLEFLEANKATYNLWPLAPGYFDHSKQLFRSSHEFSKYFPLIYGRQTFKSLRASMSYVEEFEVKSQVGNLWFDAVKTKDHLGTLTAKEKEAMHYLKYAIAHFTVAKASVERICTLSPSGIHFVLPNTETEEHKAVDIDALSIRCKHLSKQGADYLQKLVKYLNAFPADFPIYHGDVSVTKPASGSNRTSQINGTFKA